MTHAVLTGDIVDSTALSGAALDATMAELAACVDDARAWPGLSDIRMARRGGDGWQVALAPQRFDLRFALFCAARLRRLDKTRATRVALAQDSAPLPETADLNAAHGAAFTASGRLLDRIDGTQRMAHDAGGAALAATLLADHLSQGWTQAQARALSEMLPPDPGPRAEAAHRLGISRQAVDQALHAAGYPALEAALTAWENP